MTKSKIIGIDIGGTKISGGLLEQSGELLKVVTVPTMADKSETVVLNQLKMCIDELFEVSNVSKDQIKGIGICAPGPLNPKTGELINPPNLPSLWGINLKDLVSKMFSLPVIVENDANAAGYAELMIGSAYGCENVLYVTVSTGIGTGLIINKKIYHGKNGFAGEGGHISTDYYADVRCNCKAPGCIESIASGSAISNKATELIKCCNIVDSKIGSFKNNPENITTKDIAGFARQGDELSIKLIEEAAFNIGAWLGGMINLLDPDMIVIGGGVASIGDIFFNKVRETALDYTYNPNAQETPIMKAMLEKDVGVFGAASLFM